jgi:hypothetical protein
MGIDVEVVSKFVQLLLELMLVPAAALVIWYVIRWLRARGILEWVKLDAATQALLLEAVRLAVLAAEQSGLRDELLKAGAEKKRYALAFVEKYLAERGIQVDLGVVADMIEAEVYRLLKAKPV